jgi:hypothetical protein
MTLITHPTFLFLRLKIRLKDHHFDTIEVIEAESKAVLKPSKNKTSRMHLKNNSSAGNCVYMQKGTISRVVVVSF